MILIIPSELRLGNRTWELMKRALGLSLWLPKATSAIEGVTRLS